MAGRPPVTAAGADAACRLTARPAPTEGGSVRHGGRLGPPWGAVRQEGPVALAEVVPGAGAPAVELVTVGRMALELVVPQVFTGRDDLAAFLVVLLELVLAVRVRLLQLLSRGLADVGAEPVVRHLGPQLHEPHLA